MKRPERDPGFTGSGSPPRRHGQEERSAWSASRPGVGQGDAPEPGEELLSANPLEWWADGEALDDVGYAADSMLSIDGSVFPSLATTGTLPVAPLPSWRASAPPQWSSTPPHSPPAPPSPPPGWYPRDVSRADQRADQTAPRPQTPPPAPSRPPAPAASQPSSAPYAQAPLEFSDTGYVPVWQITTGRAPALVTAGAETMVAIVRRLMRSSGLYALAALGTPAVSLALTPYLAHNMSLDDYGLLAVLNTTISLFAGLTQIGLGPAFFRAFNYDFTGEKDRRSVMATSLLLMMTLSAVFLAIALPLAPFFAGLLARGASVADVTEVRIACGVIAVQNLSVPGFAWLRAEDRALSFSVVSMLNVLTTLVASIIFVGVLRGGVSGAMLANGAGYAAVVLGTLLPMAIRSQLRFSPRVARSMVTFGAPLTLSVISVWVLQLSDRYLLALFGDYGQTASYSVAYTLGSVLSTIVLAPFSLAWPTAMYSIARRADAPRVFQQVFRWFTAVLLFAAFGLSLASTVLLTILFPPSYRSAAPVIPIVAASIALYGTYTVIMVGANVRRKTWMTSAFTALAALVNVGLNLVLIPQFGSMGAAASTFLAYLALVAVAYFANQRIYPVPYEVIRALFAGMMGFALYYLVTVGPAVASQTYGAQWQSLGLPLPGQYGAIALSLVGLLVYGVWLYFLLRIRTIDFRVNPAILQRALRRSETDPASRRAREEAYVRR